jgi:hypothetical protein
MEIIPNLGLGSLRFGMVPSEVQAVLGSCETYEPWMGGNLNDSLHYPGLIIGFDKCDGRGPVKDSKLVEFRINERADVTFLNKPIFGMPQEEFDQTLTQHNIRSERNLSSYLLPELHMELDLDERGRVMWIEFSGRSVISRSQEVSRQRFLTNEDLEDARAMVGWRFWAAPIIFTLGYSAAALFSLKYDLLMQGISFLGLGAPAIFLWLMRARQYKKFDRDRRLRRVEVVEGALERVWMTLAGLCHCRLADRTIHVENHCYRELRDAKLVRVEFLPESCIAVRVTVPSGIVV